MNFGYFDDEKREYVITRPDTVLPDLVQTEESCVIFLTSLISRDAIFICGIMRAKTTGLHPGSR